MRKQELNDMGILIERLEALVATVGQTVNEVETCLVNAEIDTDSNKGTFSKLLKPFFVSIN